MPRAFPAAVCAATSSAAAFAEILPPLKLNALASLGPKSAPPELKFLPSEPPPALKFPPLEPKFSPPVSQPALKSSPSLSPRNCMFCKNSAPRIAASSSFLLSPKKIAFLCGERAIVRKSIAGSGFEGVCSSAPTTRSNSSREPVFLRISCSVYAGAFEARATK